MLHSVYWRREAFNPCDPVGATVKALPEDAEKVKRGDETFFKYGDTWYRPFYSGSDVVYMVTEAPQA